MQAGPAVKGQIIWNKVRMEIAPGEEQKGRQMRIITQEPENVMGGRELVAGNKGWSMQCDVTVQMKEMNGVWKQPFGSMCWEAVVAPSR